jgi:hypothetical protein
MLDLGQMMCVLGHFRYISIHLGHLFCQSLIDVICQYLKIPQKFEEWPYGMYLHKVVSVLNYF